MSALLHTSIRINSDILGLVDAYAKDHCGKNRSKAVNILLSRGLGTDDLSQRVSALEKAVASLRSEKPGKDSLERIREELRRLAQEMNKPSKSEHLPSNLIYSEEEL